MLTRKRLMTTILCGGLLCGTMMSGQAFSSGLLQPNSSWAVSKLAAAQTGGNPYCALARRFSNNLILTMARNSGDESSIAIDFQKTALNNTQSYHVELSPGFGQERAFNIKPVSGKALVIRLGKDYAFHDALNRSGQLALKVSGESYSFNLEDFPEGQKKLSECLVTLVEPAAGPVDAMTPPPAQAPRPTRVISAEKVEAPVSAPPPVASVNVQEVQSLREENTRLRNALERERRIYEDRLLHESQSSSMAAELNEKVRILEMENAQLEQQLAYKPAPEPATCPVPDRTTEHKLEDELAVLREDNLRLKQDLAAQHAEYAILDTKLQEALNKPAAVKAEVDTSITDRLHARVKALEEENRALKAASAVTAAGGDATSPVSLAQLRSLEEQLRYVQNDRDQLVAKMEQMSNAKGNGLLDISSDNWDLEQATRRFNEAEREIRRLGRELEDHRTQCAAQKKELEYMLFDPSVANEEQISKLMKLETENAEFEDKLSMLEIEKSEYAQKLASLEGQLANIETAAGQTEDNSAELARLDVENNELRTQRDALAEEKRRLADRVAVMATDLANAQNQMKVGGALGQEVAALQTENLALKQERDSLVIRQETLSSEKQNLSARVSTLAAELAQAGNASAANKVVQQELTLLEEENISLKAERDRLFQKQEGLAAEKRSLADRVASLSNELAKADLAVKENTLTDQQITSLEQENQSLKEERERLFQKQQELAAEKRSLADRVATLSTELAKVGDSAKDSKVLDHDLAMLEEENLRLKGERDALYKKQESLTQKVAMLESSLAAIPTGAGAASIPPPVVAEPIAYQEAGYTQQAKVSPASYQKHVPKSAGSVAPGHDISSTGKLQTLLQRARVPLQSGVELVDAVGQEFAAFSWDAGSVYGSAERQVMGANGQFEAMVNDYLDKTKSRCQGDFAAVPIMSQDNGSIKVSSYEIACVGGQGGAAASIVFFKDGNVFTTLAHESGLENMEDAMDARDNLTAMLLQQKEAI